MSGYKESLKRWRKRDYYLFNLAFFFRERQNVSLLATLDLRNEFVWKIINYDFNFARERKEESILTLRAWEIRNFYTKKLPQIE
jgi:hypothetical protein